METNHKVRLRLRFYKDVSDSIDAVLQKFENYKAIHSENYSTKVNDNHIWFHIKGTQKEYWSPHLHLELEARENNKTHIRGLFGPDPKLWTLFMFLHFIVAGIFTIFGMIAYSNYTLNEPMTMDFVIMVILIIVWLLLYVIARQIRERGHKQMDELEALFLKIVEN